MLTSWKEACITLGIAFAIAGTSAVAATIYFHQQLGHMTGSSISTIGQLASKIVG